MQSYDIRKHPLVKSSKKSEEEIQKEMIDSLELYIALKEKPYNSPIGE